MFRRLFGPFPELDAGLLFQIVLNPAVKKFGAAGHAEAAVFFHYAAAPAGGMNNFQRSAEKADFVAVGKFSGFGNFA